MAFQINRAQRQKLTHLVVEVTAFVQAGVYQTAARVYCRKGSCGREIELLCENKETPLHVECPTHGGLAVFENFADYTETLKAAINQSNDAMGLTRIDPQGQGIFERYS